MGRRVGDGPGGIFSLEDFLEAHSEAVEADLQHHYQIDLRDLWRGDLTHRRAWVLIRHLPAESATMTALRESMTDDELAAQSARSSGFGRWSQTDMLLARVGDEIAYTRYVLEAVNTPADAKRPQVPEPMPRPGVKAPKNNAPSQATLDYLQALRDNQGASPHD